MNFFGKNLRYLREKNNLTQDDMKPLLGIGNTTCSNYENGVTEPPLELLIKISKYFGVTLDELLTGDITSQHAGNIVKQRRHKPYFANEAPARLEEPAPELIFIVKELKKLRKDVEAIKERK